ncbi:MAG: DUF1732 domain-containing protein, partial [Chthoniobacterales bacterium]
LKTELKKRLRNLRQFAAEMMKHAPQVSIRYRDTLRQRLEKSGIALPLTDERLLKEIAIFAERSDISEELCRVESHFKQMTEKLEASEPAGKTLEFLTQEVFRELNTIGSKASDVEISRVVVESKSELEKIREQLSNIE